MKDTKTEFKFFTIPQWKQEQEYLRIQHNRGWKFMEYLQDFVGYSYFRRPSSEMNGHEEIFCDDTSRADMMRRVFRQRIVPLIMIFCCMIIPQICFQYHHLNYLSGKIFTGIFAVIGIFDLILFVTFTIQFWEYRKSSK